MKRFISSQQASTVMHIPTLAAMLQLHNPTLPGFEQVRIQKGAGAVLSLLFARERKLYKELSRVLEAAQGNADPHRQIEFSQAAIDLCDRIQEWPWKHPSRRLAKGAMLNCLGRGYGNLASIDPQANLRLARSAFDAALEFLRPSDGIAWKDTLVNSATAFGEKIDGDGIDERQKAEARLNQVLEVLDPMSDAPILANALVSLASLALRDTNSLNKEGLVLARSRLRQASGLRDRMEKSPQWINVSALIGEALAQFPNSFDRTTNQEAIRVLEELVHEYQDLLHSDQVAGCCNSLMMCHWFESSTVGNDTTRQSHIDRAFSYAKLGSEIVRTAGNLSALGQLQFATARLYMNRRDGDLRRHREEALTCLEEALNVLTPERYPLLHAEVRDFDLFVRSEKFSGGKVDDQETFVDHLEAALSRVDKEKEPTTWAFAAEKLASALMANYGIGQSDALERAIDLYEEAFLQIDKDVHTDPWSTLANNLAVAYARRFKGDRKENFHRAIALHQRALERIDRRGDMHKWANVMRDLALTYKDSPVGSSADNNERAICLLEEALVVVGAGLDVLGRALTLESAGDAYESRIRGDERANLERSVVLFREASRNFSEAGDEDAVSRVQTKLTSDLYRLQSDDSEQADRDSSNSATDTNKFFGRLESTVSRFNRETNTVSWFQAKLALADAYTRIMRRQLSDGQGLMAWQTELLKQSVIATEILSDAIAFLESTEYSDQLRLGRRRLASYYYMQYLILHWMEYENERGGLPVPLDFEHLDTDALLDKTSRLRFAVLDSQRADLYREQYLRDAIALAEVYTLCSQWGNALDLYESLIPFADALLTNVEASEAETVKILEALSTLASEGPAAAIESENLEAALVLAESGRARLLAKSLSLRSYYQDSELANRLLETQARMRALEEKLTDQRTLDKGTPLDELVLLRQELATLTMQSGSSKRDFSAMVREGIQDACRCGVTLVFPFQSADSGYLVVAFFFDGSYKLATTRTPSFTRLSSRMPTIQDQIDTDLEKKQEFLVRANTELAAKLGIIAKIQSRVGELFAKPLAEFLATLPEQAGKRLVIFPNGPLGNLPLGSGLVDSSRPLTERYHMSLSPSVDALSTSLNAVRPEKASVCALVNNELLASSLEVAALERFLKPSELRRCDSSSSDVASVKRALESSNIWHFATHGKFSPENLTDSGLQVNADEWISISDLRTIANIDPPSLVIVSACVSGLYDVGALPNEYIGLPSIFMQLGAAGVIASLWPVNEIPTALLFCMFFSCYAENGQQGPAALRKAQLWLRSASVADLQSMVQRLVGLEGVTEESAAEISDTIERNAKARGTKPGEAPYQSALYWGSFVYYGV